ncbi:hypothetical protein ACQ4PT_011396 [Festuca glaucescens]
MEAAIGWLADTILATLQIGKLDAWIRRAGLADDTEKLRCEVERVELLVRAVRCRAAGNAPPARSLARLRELLYEADDVVDDLDYCRLQQQVQGVTWDDTEGMHEEARVAQRSRGGDADIPSSSGGKKQSKAWDDFDITEKDTEKLVKAKCKHCQQVVECRTDKWTSVLHNHAKSEGCKKKLGATDQPPNPSRVQNSGSFEITQLQSMNKLLQLGISQLENVTTTNEAAGAKLRHKIHLEKLCLSWKYTYHSDIAWEVLDGLEPHQGLKHLQIFGYNGATSPTWLASNISVTSLQTLHLEDCGEWQILPSLEMLPFLTKLKLCRMQKVTEATFPSLEELILIEMPNLEKCSCTSMSYLNSSLRVLHIKMCRALKVFVLFEKCNNFESKMKPWLPGLRKLIIYDCPHLRVMHPLPPSTNCFELFISRVSTFPMERSSRETLEIGGLFAFHHVPSYEMRALDDRILAFHNLRDLKYLCIRYCRNLMSIPFKGFSQLVSLKSLKISDCRKLFSLDIPEHTYEDMVAANFIALPYLEQLDIHSCGIAGKWLSLMLRHAPALMVLKLGSCPQIT